MPTSEDFFNWRFSGAPATIPCNEVNVTYADTPYQPHNQYKNHRNRKVIIILLVCIAFALLSVAASITLYITVGMQEGKGRWIFRAWIVVSAGVTVMLAIMTGAFYWNCKTARNMNGDRGCGNAVEMRNLGRNQTLYGSPLITRAPLVRSPYPEASFASPATNLQTNETEASPYSHRTTHDPVSPLDKHDSSIHHSPLDDSPSRSPSPLLPPPVKFQYTGERPLPSSPPVSLRSNTPRKRSSESVVTVLPRSELRRKQRFESLK